MHTAMPLLRLLATALAATACTLAGAAAVSAETAPDAGKAAAMAPINFFLARGEADVCGPGCNEWIAAEGKIDPGAAARLRRLLAKLGRRRPPIYFHSPGGAITGSLELGRLIREQKLAVSVAHTIPLSCDRDKSFEKSCEAQKRSGQELEAEFDPLLAMCNSACVYVVAGGAVRLIPPWVELGVHDVGFDPDAPPPRALVGQVKRQAHEHIQEYLRDMGMDDALYKAAAAVPFESKKFLERDELVRFGIDRRDFAETGWQLIDKPVLAIAKRFFVRTEDGGQVRDLDGAVSLSCGVGQAIGLVLAQRRGASETSGTGPRLIGLSVKGQQYQLTTEVPTAEVDMRGAALPASTFDAIDDDAMLAVSGTTLAPGGSVGLSMHGFSTAYAKLRKLCDAPTRNATAVTLPGMPVPYVTPGSLQGLSAPAVAGRPGAFSPASPWPR
jgi:hypothetical protein